MVQSPRVQAGDRSANEPIKWAKAILQVGDRQDRTLRRGQSLAVVVLFDGHALAGVELTGGYAGVASRRVKTVTDSDGRATLVMEESGRWYLRTIHMLRLADNGDDPEAIWESFWSTLTFEVSP